MTNYLNSLYNSIGNSRITAPLYTYTCTYNYTIECWNNREAYLPYSGEVHFDGFRRLHIFVYSNILSGGDVPRLVMASMEMVAAVVYWSMWAGTTVPPGETASSTSIKNWLGF